jgi:hypothetical protein
MNESGAWVIRKTSASDSGTLKTGNMCTRSDRLRNEDIRADLLL